MNLNGEILKVFPYYKSRMFLFLAPIQDYTGILVQ